MVSRASTPHLRDKSNNHKSKGHSRQRWVDSSLLLFTIVAKAPFHHSEKSKTTGFGSLLPPVAGKMHNQIETGSEHTTPNIPQVPPNGWAPLLREHANTTMRGVLL